MDNNILSFSFILVKKQEFRDHQGLSESVVILDCSVFRLDSS